MQQKYHKKSTLFSLQIKLIRKYQPLDENKSKGAIWKTISKYSAGAQENTQPTEYKFL